MILPIVKTWGEYERLTPEQQLEHSRRWLAEYQRATERAELLSEIGSFDQHDLHERFGSGDE